MSFLKKDRFDLEMEISKLYSTVDDLQVVANQMYDGKINYSPDRQHTTLTGLAEVLEAKIANVEDVFCRVFELNEYNTNPEVEAFRREHAERLKQWGSDYDLNVNLADEE